MCSCSTTLFNAAMRAGLDIHARRNHSYYITRYPVGLDATVWIASAKSQQTMSFVNDTQYPILIKGINSAERGQVRALRRARRPHGRAVRSGDRERRRRRRPSTSTRTTWPPARRNLIEFTVDGFDSTVVRTVKDAAGTIIHEDTFKSHYLTIDGLIMVGRYPGDPVAGTQVLEAVWKANH